MEMEIYLTIGISFLESYLLAHVLHARSDITGATTQLILLPGNNWTSAATFISNGSAAALSKVTNPDGSITGLIFDVHKYLDNDNSGTNAECVTDNIADAWAPLAEYLRANKRQAINTESRKADKQHGRTHLDQVIINCKVCFIDRSFQEVVHEELPPNWKSECIESIILHEMLHLPSPVRAVVPGQGGQAALTVQIPSKLHPKSKPAMLTPVNWSFPLGTGMGATAEVGVLWGG
ncbi:hypothetical protein BDN71DRAFT_1587686 [Pleurotus eryngii]|uniref:cellulase n=1 Tax=Pleurotus eryngii TaxID=5323 RepID=A0A9P6DHR5_PLEER|nr:hypothetical protein BDN71DRAFT_1587686 [Pleurotus eryngii]